MSQYRYYQAEADAAIYDELVLQNADKCLVKMFCGTGKSLLMRQAKINQDKRLVVYVFPILALLDQFYSDYLHDFPSQHILKVSSENEATTDPLLIKQFLQLNRENNKIICITYQSFSVLIDNLTTNKIDVCNLDEAHHAVGKVYQTYIFNTEFAEHCDKTIFYTCTPNNRNDIVMYDRDNMAANMCGKLVYDYSYLRGKTEGYLNPFEIRIDMYTENTNKSVFESIARAILVSGNSRCLTFHSDVNTGRETSVKMFVNQAEFKRVFKEVCKTEFPALKTKYKRITMIALSADISSGRRKELLNEFDACPDNEVYIISSCETIGEGIDTKNANMCVFVDPKSSSVKIIQNIGRIVRKVFEIEKPRSTVLIPCWVDKTKYLDCDKDREKCDAAIREGMSASGNFNSVLNVLSALKQEDEDLYDACLNYPNSFSPDEIKSNLLKQGYEIGEPVGSLLETVEHLLDTELDYDLMDELDTDEAMLQTVAEDNDVCIEIHSTSLETPIEKYNEECDSGEIIRIYRDTESVDENESDLEETRYRPITKRVVEEGESNKKTREAIDSPKSRMGLNVHTNPDVQVLWSISESDLTKELCSCIIDCEVVKYDPMDRAIEIVERAKIREANGGHLLPKNNKLKTTLELIQENKDAQKLQHWKAALKGKGDAKCFTEVQAYLDEKLVGWRNEINWNIQFMQDAVNIVERAKIRESAGFDLLPRYITNISNRTTVELEQQHKDAQKLGYWKQSLKGHSLGKCPNSVCAYLDEHLCEWRNAIDFNLRAMQHACNIVKRVQIRKSIGLHILPRNISKENRITPELEQENKDAQKLNDWKKALKSKGSIKCPTSVRNYLDKVLPEWTTTSDLKSVKFAEAIVKRAKIRETNGSNLLPQQIQILNRTTTELKQEHKDAQKLCYWKKALKGTSVGKCSDDVRDYLDKHLISWRDEIDTNVQFMQDATNIVTRAKIRESNGCNLLPRHMSNRSTPELEQEHKDAQKLGCWKKHLKGQKGITCPNNICNYLDNCLTGWRDTLDMQSMQFAKAIVERAKIREANGMHLLPRNVTNMSNRPTPELEQEYKDATKLNNWKQSFNGSSSKTCSDEVQYYLDTHLYGWRNFVDYDGEAMQFAADIVKRAKIRYTAGFNLLPRKNQNRPTPDLLQEYKDAEKLGDWKQSLKGLGDGRCCDKVCKYLDEHLPKWRDETDYIKNAIQLAKDIVTRAKNREATGLNVFPKEMSLHKRTTPTLIQEFKDARKLQYWKSILQGSHKGICCNDVRDYLDENLTGWRKHQSESTSTIIDQSVDKESSEMIIEEDEEAEWSEPHLVPDGHHLSATKFTSFLEDIEKEDKMVVEKEDREKSKKRKLTTLSKTKRVKQTDTDPIIRRQQTKSQLSVLHQQYKTLKSANLKQLFQESPALWHEYHAISEANEECFDTEELPRNRICAELDKIKTRRSKQVVDLGCGKALIAQHFANDPRFTFTNYDHVASNDTVISCDISNVPLEDAVVEICILSLAMWGSNCKEYVREAYRILESGGTLFIIEPTKRWSPKDADGNILELEEGAKLAELLEENGFQIISKSIQKFALFEVIKR